MRNKVKNAFIYIGLLFSIYSFSQEDSTALKPYKTVLYGYSRVDYIWDTRQSAQVREFHLNLWPLDVKNDSNGNDINASGASNFLSVVSRLGVKATGPDVWGAKVNGVLEGDFFGNTQQSIALFRIRHAYSELIWENTTLIFGQTWYPHFIKEVYPGVANFSTGMPFNPFGWATQFRINQKLSQTFTYSFTVYKDREFGAVTADFQNNSPVYNSFFPSMHNTLEARHKAFIIGLGAELRAIKPLIESNNLKTNETLYSSTFLSYFKYNHKKFHIKAYAITGENLTHLVMLGGYASFENGNNPATYKGIRTNSIWLDIASNNDKTAPGFFIGYSNQNGVSASNQLLSIYARGINQERGVKNIWRTAARIDFKENNFRITPELEYTGATHGDTNLTNLRLANNLNSVGNFRVTVSAVYSY
jgi:hypothetical protein